MRVSEESNERNDMGSDAKASPRERCRCCCCRCSCVERGFGSSLTSADFRSESERSSWQDRPLRNIGTRCLGLSFPSHVRISQAMEDQIRDCLVMLLYKTQKFTPIASGCSEEKHGPLVFIITHLLRPGSQTFTFLVTI